MKCISLFFSILVLASCNPKQESKSNEKVVFDTVTPLHHCIQLIAKPQDTTVELRYGIDDSHWNRRPIDFDTAKERLHNRIFDFKDFISLRSHCGYNCWADEFFDIHSKSKSFIVYNVLQIQPETNWIVYYNSEENSIPTNNSQTDTGQLTVLNLKTKAKQYIHLEHLAVSQNVFESIKAIEFHNDTLLVKWLSEEKGPEAVITRTDTIVVRV